MSLIEKYSSYLTPKILIFIYLVIFAIGLILSLALNRIDLMYRAMYFVIPLSIASFILIRNKFFVYVCSDNNYLVNNISILTNRQYLIMFSILYLVSIVSLIIYEVRPLYYFISITIIVVIVFFEIITLDLSRKNTTFCPLILLQIILISLNLIWGVTLKYDLYFAGTDAIVHMKYIESILTQSYLTDDLGPYIFYPLYHILYSICINLMNLPKYQTMFLVSGLIFQIGILFCYLIIRNITQDARAALLSTLFLVVSQEYIYYGTYVVTRIIAGILFMELFYLILIKNKGISPKLLFILVMWVLILYHHVSMPFILIIFTIFYILDLAYIGKNRILSGNKLIMLLSSFLFYALYIAISSTKNILMMTFTSDFKSEVNLGTPMLTNVKIFLMEHVNLSIFLFLFSIGIYFILSDKDQKIDLKKISLLSLIFLITYIPTPLTSLTLLNEVLRFDRFSFLIAPFMITVMTFGIFYFIKLYKTKKILYILALLVFVYSFVSIMQTSNAPDYPIFQNKSDVANRYFTVNELKGISYLEEKCPSNNRFSDFFVYRLLGEKPNINMITKQMLEEPHGCILIRDNEWKSRTLLFLEKDTYPLRMTYYNKKELDKNNLNINCFLIYNNSGVNIYYRG